MASRAWPTRRHTVPTMPSAADNNADDDADTMSSGSANDEPRPPRSPYIHASQTASSSTFNNNPSPPAPAPPQPVSLTSSSSSSSCVTPTPTAPGTPRIAASRKPSSLRHVSNAPASESAPTIKRRQTSPSAKDSKNNRHTREQQRFRTNPRLPHSDDVPTAPATAMYWSRAPVHGALPMHNMRAHTVTLVDNVAWLFGGCDDKDCWKDIYCFDIETMHWSHPEMLGQVPPPCRAHTATLVDRKIVIFGGGEGPAYYDSTFILDTTTRRWFTPTFPAQAQPIPPDADPLHPAPRRAHTAVLYCGKIYVFGGGNGLTALNDLWTLDVSRLDTSLRGSSTNGGLKWTLIKTNNKPPPPRGYHTANLVGSVMVVVGGSDGRECFSDVWCLNLESLMWTRVSLTLAHRRLSHTSTQVGSYLFIIGGHDGTTYSPDMLFYNLVNLQYDPRPVFGKPPSPRGYHVSLIADSRLFVFGGFNGHDVFDDVHILDLAGAAYLPQVMSFRIDVD